MTAKVITFGISKGGASKSTSSGITAWILSQEANVLCIDMDGQGNLTSFLTGEYDICNAFEEKTILEALQEEDVRPYILKVNETLDVIPSNDFLSLLPRNIYRKEIRLNSLTKALEPVMDKYDYIIIDTPPSLGEATIMGLSASSESGSYAVVMFDGSMFCYYAVPKFLEIVEEVKSRVNPDIQVAGILFSLIDVRVKENIAMEELIDSEYPDLRFKNVIRRKASTKRLAINGFMENEEMQNALEYYYPFVKELKKRVEKESVRTR